VFKRSIEIGLALILISVVLVIIRFRQSGPAEKGLGCVSLGIVVVFWLHRGLFYLLLH
jgi:hypothetical protein